jgi:hypothetical protein
MGRRAGPGGVRRGGPQRLRLGRAQVAGEGKEVGVCMGLRASKALPCAAGRRARMLVWRACPCSIRLSCVSYMYLSYMYLHVVVRYLCRRLISPKVVFHDQAFISVGLAERWLEMVCEPEIALVGRRAAEPWRFVATGSLLRRRFQ